MLSPSTRSAFTLAELEESLEEVHGRASSVKSLGKMSAAVVDNVECKAAHGDLSTHNASSADAPKIFDRTRSTGRNSDRAGSEPSTAASTRTPRLSSPANRWCLLV